METRDTIESLCYDLEVIRNQCETFKLEIEHQNEQDKINIQEDVKKVEKT